MDPGSDGVRALTIEECYRLLATAQLGRLALSHKALPVVLPVSSMLHDRRIVIQTTGGPILDAARAAPVVAFEADDIEPCTYAGWSVVVTGQMRVVTDSYARLTYESSLAFPRITAKHRHFVTVTPSLVTGLHRLPMAD
jgi:nitroimidazol reductase NimA-like FMN-containing flavoprotein (pyridoxamine 5'-phosphate oxidase superfamily)